MSSGTSESYALWAAVESVRYWAPSINDVARFDEREIATGWQVEITPHAPRACAVRLGLHANRSLDLWLAGEAHEASKVPDFDYVLPLLKAVSEGRALHRHWLSAATGVVTRVESIVRLANGSEWRETRHVASAAGHDPAGLLSRDYHFLPYRR